MRISDWSSDVCSSDLIGEHAVDHPVRQVAREQAVVECGLDAVGRLKTAPMLMPAKQGFEPENVADAKVDLCLPAGYHQIAAQRLAGLGRPRPTVLPGPSPLPPADRRVRQRDGM